MVVVHEAEAPTTLCLAARTGDVDLVQTMLDAQADPGDVRALDQNTAVSVAADRGHVDVLDVLIRAGASVNAARTSGTTPLVMAAQHGQAVTLQQLIRADADVSLAMDDGRGPLFVARSGVFK